MSDIALRVHGLGKRYRLGIQDPAAGGGMYRYRSLRDSLGGFAKNPLRSARRAFARSPMTEDNSFWALKDVDFEVKRGEVVGVIGRNGAGKSTLLKVLSRITKPTDGRVDLYGRVGSLLEVGTGFHPELSGRENIYLNGAVLGMTRAEVKAKFDEIVAFSEVERFLDTPVKQYSSGMYMRLAFAVAAHLEPEILVVDEVLAVGDATFQKKCLGKMRDVASEGKTVLFVSHNMGAVRELCSSACLLKAGRVEARGDIEPIIQQYLRTATATTDVLAADVGEQKLVGPARIHRCRVEQPVDSGHAQFVSEQGIRVCVDVDHQAGAIISFGIRIRTALGQDMLHVTSQDEVEAIRLPADRTRLYVDVPPVPYNDGDYFITFYLCDRQYQLMHLLVDAVSFTVDNSHRGHKHASSPLKVSSEWSWKEHWS